MNVYRAIRRGTLFKSMLGREPFRWIRPSPGIVEFGSKYGRWAVDATRLGPATVVASFGLGEDVSFEAALIERHGCRVFGFDPTPRSVRFIEREVRLPRFRAFPYALADREGTIEFKLPPERAADQTSASAVADYAESEGSVIEVPCLTLAAAKDLVEVKQIDVLKMDIEGAEYAVIDQSLAENGLEGVQQLLVEFHHFLPGLKPAQTRKSIAALESAGFRIRWIGRTNHEYLFTRDA